MSSHHTADAERVGASFRDPSGFVFQSDGVVYRQVHTSYRSNYEFLVSSGLYDNLTKQHLLISHTEIDHQLLGNRQTYKVLRPEQVPFISYPFEWAFSQLKDAAILTVDVQKRCVEKGMILKDASAYNIAFLEGKPILIDSLSFDRLREGQAWPAYRQFCQHFLAPLLLMSYKDIRLSQMLRIYMDGIPLDLAASILPRRTFLNLGVTLHLHLHARAQKRYAGTSPPGITKSRAQLDKKALMNICDNLRSTIEGLSWNHRKTSWSGYYGGDSYQDESFENKCELVTDFLNVANPKCVWDLGANTGVFSRLASQRGIFTVSIDSDPGVVEENYLQAKQQKDINLHPLLVDLSNPSAKIGWANSERESLAERCNADCVLALALIHHIAITNNVPLYSVAEYLAILAEWLIIEFVPKGDKQVQRLLVSRHDIFSEYSQCGFEDAFSKFWDFVKLQRIQDSERILYLMHRKQLSESYSGLELWRQGDSNP